MLTPSTVTPRGFSRSCMFIIEGSSCEQGVHHVAQKFNTRTWPRNWLRLTLRSESTTVKSFAGVPTRGGRDPRLQAFKTRIATSARKRKRLFTGLESFQNVRHECTGKIL